MLKCELDIMEYVATIEDEYFENIESDYDNTDTNNTTIEAQGKAAPLNVDAIAATIAPYPEAFRTIRRDAEKLDIYHDKDTAEYFKHVFAELNILLFANSVQRGAIDGGAYYILEDGAIIRVYVDGAFPRFA